MRWRGSWKRSRPSERVRGVEGFQVVERFPMHWGEMDALGHANNTRYFLWFETARIAYFRRIVLEADRPSHIGPILATTTCDFLEPIAFPAQLAVGARVTKMGRSSFTMEYRVALQSDEDRPLAKGTAVIVLYDYVAKASIPIPDELRASIANLDKI
jgi:acyl-CoA thioester hydrolase